MTQSPRIMYSSFVFVNFAKTKANVGSLQYSSWLESSNPMIERTSLILSEKISFNVFDSAQCFAITLDNKCVTSETEYPIDFFA